MAPKKAPNDGAVLVAYASKHGATREIAARVASTMREAGCRTFIADADDVPNLDAVGAVILGSALYAGRVRGSARRFARRHRHELADKPVWLFTSGPVDVGDKHREAQEPKAALKLAEHLGAHGHVMFGGRLPTEPGNVVERAMVRATPEERRDARDWEAIDAWARSVAAQLAPAMAVPAS
jgi:menaquinone-dependent protoporphyrinogen oxidase